MAMMTRILVFPCGTEIGLEIHNSLKWSTHIGLVGASSVSSNHGRYVYREYVDGVAFAHEDGFIGNVNEIVRNCRIDLIFPAHDSAVVRLAEGSAELACGVIGSGYETARVCRSKRATYALFRDDLTVPALYAAPATVDRFPVFMKPDVGEGSKGTIMANSPDEVSFHVARDPSLLILEYLPGREFTVDCFTDRSGVLRFVGPRERIRIAGGISVDTAPVVDVRLEEMAATINRKLQLRGAWFFQVRERSNGEPALLEIAPRVGGSMGVHRVLGVNLALLSVFDALGGDVALMRNDYGVRMDRALCNRFITDLRYEHVYVDLDDTIVFNGRLNTLIMAFLFQCVNRGIGIHLVSKHAGSVGETLRRHRIESLFDSVVAMPGGDCKVDFIVKRPAIFIDDSFVERQRVHEALGIPVFDTHAVEALMSWTD